MSAIEIEIVKKLLLDPKTNKEQRDTILLSFAVKNPHYTKEEIEEWADWEIAKEKGVVEIDHAPGKLEQVYLTEKEKMALPNFEEYIITGVRSLDPITSTSIQHELSYYAAMSEMSKHREVMRKLSKEAMGKYKEGSDEEAKALQEWWFHYSIIRVNRAFLLQRFGFKPPDWNKLQPERYYVGSILNNEDFNYFMQVKSKKVIEELVVQENELIPDASSAKEEV